MENAKKGGEAIVENINFFFGSLTANRAQPQRSFILLCCYSVYSIYILDIFGGFIGSLAVPDSQLSHFSTPYFILCVNTEYSYFVLNQTQPNP